MQLRLSALGLAMMMMTMVVGRAGAEECRLTLRECATVRAVLAQESEEQDRDRMAVGPYPDHAQTLALVDRHFDRLEAGAKRLPKRVSAEVIRINACDVALRHRLHVPSATMPTFCVGP